MLRNTLLTAAILLIAPHASAAEDEAGWTSLFNGKNLDGWVVKCRPNDKDKTGYWKDETRGVQVWLWPDVGRPANAKPEHAPEGWNWRHADSGEDWNDVEIVCRGTRIKTTVNGIVIADCDGTGRLDDEVHRSRNVGMKGHIGLQIHPGNELRIRFKDIEVKRL